MRAVIQRVKKACVSVDGENKGTIGRGLLIYLGISAEDDLDKVDFLVKKILNMRIFPDDDGKMNKSVLDEKLSVLVVSQFTLLADCKKGNRPNFMNAAHPDKAIPMYERFIERASESLNVQSGVFGATMEVESINDGPVTIVMEV